MSLEDCIEIFKHVSTTSEFMYLTEFVQHFELIAHIPVRKVRGRIHVQESEQELSYGVLWALYGLDGVLDGVEWNIIGVRQNKKK